jgi:hypothetical protein
MESILRIVCWGIVLGALLLPAGGTFLCRFLTDDKKSRRRITGAAAAVLAVTLVWTVWTTVRPPIAWCDNALTKAEQREAAPPNPQD